MNKEYYTRKECFKLCGDNDIPFIEGSFNASEQRTMSELVRDGAPGYHFFDIIKWADYDKWQIKRADPVILSADEYAQPFIDDEKKPDSDPYCQRCWVQGQREGFEAGDKNGQLREYYRPEQVELREAITEFLAHYDERHTFDGRALTIFNKLKKLKPPYN